MFSLLALLGMLVLTGEPTPSPNSLTERNDHRGNARFGDMAAYWVAGRAVLEHENPFDPGIVAAIEEQENLAQAFVIWNPPWILPLTALLAILPFTGAGIVWCGINVALALWSGESIGRREGMPPFSTALATITFLPIIFCIGMSQWSIVVLSAVIGYDALRRQGRPFVGGLILGFAAIKPHLALLVWLVPIWMGSRRDRALTWMGNITTLLTLLSITHLWDAHLIPDYFQALLHPAANAPTNYLAATSAVWLRAALESGLGRSLTGFQFLPAILGLMFASGWLISSRRNDSKVVPLLMLGSMVVLPYGWHYDQVLLLPIYLSLWSEVHRSLCRYRSVSLGLSLVLFNAGMGMMALLGMNESHYFLWPLALALIWYLGRPSQETDRANLAFAV